MKSQVKHNAAKLLMVIAVVFLLLGCFSALAEPETSGTCGPDLTWTVEDQGTLIISGSGAMDDYWDSAGPWKYCEFQTVIIENGVTSIGAYAFSGCSNLTSITIPDSVTSIDAFAFSGCSSLTSITIPDSVTSIGNTAFFDCSSLTSITLPDSVTSIGDNAFYNCSSLTNITIPDGVTSIGYCAFRNCSSLTSITIPDSVTSIGDNAFENCSSLTSITIPDRVTSIGNFTFLGCSSLTSITIPDSVRSIGDNAFGSCSSLTSITIPDRVTSIDSNAFSGCSSLTSITIPDSITKIEAGVFSGCSSLTSITIPDSVTSIGNSAFFDCSSLTSITISDSVTSIGAYAFSGCSSLTSITIPDSVTSIGYCAFRNCSSLTSITIPDSVRSIGDNAFEYCSSLTSITIPDSVLVIGVYAFSGCSSLTSITLPDSVTSIGDYAFYNCSSLTSITLQDSVTSIGDSAFYGCSNLKSITIPDCVVYIGDNAFYSSDTRYYCNIGSTAALYLSKNWYAFRVPGQEYPLRYRFTGDIVTGLDIVGTADKDIVTANIPPEITRIPSNTFSNCKQLTTVFISNGVLQIDSNAFYNCTSLASVMIPESVTSIAQDFFAGCPNLVIECLQDSCAHEYAINYGLNYNIILPANACGDTLTWSKDETGVLTIRGTGAMLDYSASNPAPWGTDITSVILPDGITYIGANTFSGCSQLGSIALKQQITGIGANAFKGCGNLEILCYEDTPACLYAQANNIVYNLIQDYEYQIIDDMLHITAYVGHDRRVEIPLMIDGYYVDTIDDNAFANMSFIASKVRVPYGVIVESGAFAGSSCGWTYYGEDPNGYLFEMDENVTITGYQGASTVLDLPVDIDGYPVTRIAAGAFEGRSTLTGSVIIPPTVTEVGARAFKDCTNLNGTLSISGATVTVGDYAFMNCSSLGGSFDFVSQLDAIGKYAFYNCAGLTGTVTINAAEWGSHSFQNCIGLNTIVCGTPSGEIPAYAFAGCTGLTMNSFSLGQFNLLFDEMDFNYSYRLNIRAHAFDGASLTSIDWYGEDINSIYTYEQSTNYIFNIGDCAFANSNLSNVLLWGQGITMGAKVFENSHVNNASLANIGYKTLYGADFDTLGLSMISTDMDIQADTFENTSFRNLSLSIDIPREESAGGSFYIHTGALSGKTFNNITLLNGQGDCWIEEGAFSGSTMKRVNIETVSIYIGDGAFINCNLDSLSVQTRNPDYHWNYPYDDYSISIGDNAFKNAVVRDSIALTNTSSGTLSVGEQAFMNAAAGSGITIAAVDGISIGDHAFNGFQGDITLSSVSSLGQYAFAGCDGLSEITLDAAITEIKAHTFQNCRNLSDISLANVTAIGDCAFAGCEALTGLTFNNSLSSLGAHAFEGCTGMRGNLTIPTGIRTIQENTFTDCGFDGKLTLPTGMTGIESEAFKGTHFTTINLPTTMRSLGASAFAGCDGLTSITIPGRITGSLIAEDTVQSGQGVFADCSSLQTVTVSSGITRIGKETFKGCTALSAVNLPSTVKSIGASAFESCTSLSSVVLPSGLNTLGSQAFANCNAAIEVHIPDSTDTIGNDLLLNDAEAIIYSTTGSTAELYAYDQGIAFIDPDYTYSTNDTQQAVAITGYQGSNSSLILPRKWKQLPVSEIDDSAFASMTGITTVEIKSPIQSIGASAFSGCTGLQEIIIPNSVVSVNDIALNDTSADLALVVECNSYAQNWAKTHERLYHAQHHTPQTVTAGVEPTCEEDGLTEGTVCAVCGDILSTQSIIPALGHLPEIDLAAAPTCMETGLTEGSHCSRCNKILVAQEEVPALGHVEAVDLAIAPDCLNTGLTEGKHCSRCNAVLVAQEEIPALGHEEVIDTAVAPTCTETGLTEGKHCSRCDAVLVAQEEIPALGHEWGEAMYEWESDHKAVTAVCRCIRDAQHEETETVSATVRVDIPTENEEGIAVFTTESFENEAFAVQTYTQIIPALHEMNVMYLPKGIKIIEGEAFAGLACQAVIIPDGCTEIGPNAFAQCDRLWYVQIPASVTRIAEDAFDACSNAIIVQLEVD